VLNPDCRVVPGMLGGLREALDAHPEAGMVGPNVSMDEDGDVLLPPNEMVDPFVDALAHMTRTSDAVARWNARRRARFAYRVWRAATPMSVPMLSGGCFMGRRAEFDRLGLFDPGFPLYYEDTDLFRRFVDAGFILLQVPSTRVVHFFSRSAGQRPKASNWRHAVSARRFLGRWYGPGGLAAPRLFRDARGNWLVTLRLRDL
jgi:GT2 family glycosyltransferase